MDRESTGHHPSRLVMGRLSDLGHQGKSSSGIKLNGGTSFGELCMVRISSTEALAPGRACRHPSGFGLIFSVVSFRAILVLCVWDFVGDALVFRIVFGRFNFDIRHHVSPFDELSMMAKRKAVEASYQGGQTTERLGMFRLGTNMTRIALTASSNCHSLGLREQECLSTSVHNREWLDRNFGKGLESLEKQG
jgi:hypothetical protein